MNRDGSQIKGYTSIAKPWGKDFRREVVRALAPVNKQTIRKANLFQTESPEENLLMTQLNVLGTELQACCFEPMTGYFRDGHCRTDDSDRGSHVICAQVTEEFLQFSLSRGNDLITPHPPYFPGLKQGDFWCLCAARWREAYEVMSEPPKIKLLACHERALEYVSLDILKKYAIDLS